MTFVSRLESKRCSEELVRKSKLKLLKTFPLSCSFPGIIPFLFAMTSVFRVFPRPFTHGGGTSAGGQSVNGGGTHEGGHRPNGGDLTLIDYIIN